MMQQVVAAIFASDVVILLMLLAGSVWSVARPAWRIWPPPARNSWQFWLTWTLFIAVFAANAALLILDWNSWLFRSKLRFVLGGPLIILGLSLALWGIRTLGTRNSAGLQGGLVKTGPYAFTRNPQYLGDMLMFVGLSLVANSILLWIAHCLLILVFLVTPLAEEIWLEEMYGEEYANYWRDSARFL